MPIPSAHLFLQLAASLIALPWVVRFIESAIGLPKVPNLLDPRYDRTPAAAPVLTVIVPARNEAAGIRPCIESLLNQDYPHLHIIAVDDRSTDSTGLILDSLAAAHPSRLRVLHVDILPPNWLGKPHAMALAARTAIALQSPDFLLFTDADVVFAPTILRRSLAQAQATRADHFLTLPTTLTHTAGESMLLAFLQTLSLLAVRPWRIHTPSRRDTLGVGAFNLVRTSAYLHIGGFEATPNEIVEDLSLGRRIKAAGLQQRAAYAPGAVALHWAPGLFGVLHGMTKNIFAIFHFRPLLLLGAALGLFTFCAGPWLLLIPHATRIPAALAIAALAGLYTLMSPRTLFSPAWFPTAPIAAALLVYSMLRSMYITLRDGGVTWRGTFYPLQTLKR